MNINSYLQLSEETEENLVELGFTSFETVKVKIKSHFEKVYEGEDDSGNVNEGVVWMFSVQNQKITINCLDKNGKKAKIELNAVFDEEEPNLSPGIETLDEYCNNIGGGVFFRSLSLAYIEEGSFQKEGSSYSLESSIEGSIISAY